ncbi:hypothetical protein [Shewanella algae]|uniref:hypothetical protein n=1 Tax=Shewanella algae TaxID=38313 RepID=UPI0031F53FFB
MLGDWVVPTAISALLVFVGWIVLYRNARKLASRNEAFTFASRINAKLKEISDLSEDFWLKGTYNNDPQVYEFLTLSKIKSLNLKLKIMEERQLKLNDNSKYLFDIRRACTYSASNISKLSLPKKREEMSNILDALDVLESELDKLLKTKFPPNY